jgi:hypothetical protein
MCNMEGLVVGHHNPKQLSDKVQWGVFIVLCNGGETQCTRIILMRLHVQTRPSPPPPQRPKHQTESLEGCKLREGLGNVPSFCMLNPVVISLLYLEGILAQVLYKFLFVAEVVIILRRIQPNVAINQIFTKFKSSFNVQITSCINFEFHFMMKFRQ